MLSQVEGSDRRWRGAISDGGDRSQVEEISGMRRRAIAVELVAEFFNCSKLANSALLIPWRWNLLTQRHVLIICAVECRSEPFSLKHWALSASGPIITYSQ